MLKRTFDVLASGVGLIALLPLFLILGVLIRIDSHGPTFYRANRVGKGGQSFKLFKFRTMVVNADKMGPGITTASDPRITKMGRFLRRSKLDELPQLINVFKGDMSVVGPRPEDPRYVALYNAEQREVLNVKPGITSPASFAFRNEEEMLQGQDWENLYINEIMPEKLAIDLDYSKHSSLLLDLQIVCRTGLAILKAIFTSQERQNVE